MYGVDLEEALLCDKWTKDLLVGVFAADKLPCAITRPAILIANTDPQRKPGAHWVAFYIDEFGRGEFFDSYGLPPLVREHRQFLDRHCSSWTYNGKGLQGLNSKVCGEYCVLYLAHRARGLSLSEFLWYFKKFQTPCQNDAWVKKQFTKYFGQCIKPQRVMCRSQCCCARLRTL